MDDSMGPPMPFVPDAPHDLLALDSPDSGGVDSALPSELRKAAEPLPGENMIVPTPHAIEEQLRGLHGAEVLDLASLTAEVRARSLYRPLLPRDGCRGFPLFQSRHTGKDRLRQTYVCRQPGCSACVQYEIHWDRCVLVDATFMHNHEIELTSSKGVDSLTQEERTSIQTLTQDDFTAEQILRKTGLIVLPQSLYDARRPILKELKTNQAEKLRQELHEWKDLETHFCHDAEGKLTGCYFLNKILMVPIVCRTLGMDDTSCTNVFALPLILVVGSDEHGLNQIVAFALTLNRTEKSFEHFLLWLKSRLPATDQDEKPLPRAFVVDPHLGQFNALTMVFPESRIVFCCFHLKQNLAVMFGELSPVLKLFDDFVKCRVTEEDYLARLAEEQPQFDEHTSQWTALEFLRTGLEHFSPCRIGHDTRHQASSFVESANSGVKAMLGHQIETLLNVADAVRMISQRSLLHRLRITPSSPLQPYLMTEGDQSKLGQYALKRLKKELSKYGGLILKPDSLPGPEVVIARQCCRTAIMRKLPCCHLVQLRFQERYSLNDRGFCPVLFDLQDIPAEYLRVEISDLGPVAHTTEQVDPDGLQPKRENWSYAHLSQRCEPIFNAAPRDKECRTMLRRLFHDWENHSATISTGPGFKDPSRPRGRGHQCTRPAARALASLRRSKKKGKSTPASNH
jgi:hypothetical protein